MTTISLEHVKKQYPNGFTAIHDLSLEIQDQEFLVLVGPSGCGKTTLLRMIAGLEKISSGKLFIDGKLMNDVEAKDRDLAMVFQNYALYPHFTVFDNMAFSLKMRRVKKEIIKEKVEEAASILGLEDYLQRRPSELSGGQRQRVAMGRALVRQPKAFLMDEPLSNLDAKLRVEMREEISRLYKRLKTTFIYVTHDQTEAMTLGTRVVVMDQGIIRQSGPPQELYEKPANLFVAGFIGNHEMNFIPLEDVGVQASEVQVAGVNPSVSETSEDQDTTIQVSEMQVAGVQSSVGETSEVQDSESSATQSDLGQYIIGIRPEHLKLEKVGPASTDLGAEQAALDAGQVDLSVGRSNLDAGPSHLVASQAGLDASKLNETTGTLSLLTGRIQFQEMLGEDDLIFVENGSQRLSVLTPHGLDLKLGDQVHLSAQMSDIHFFDKASGEVREAPFTL